MYWSFNCDSSWLTFESPSKNREILFSLGDGLQSMTGRLGYVFAQEYKNHFLIQNNVISGCCSPPDFYLYDKHTGKLKEELGCILFYGKDKKLPFIISVSNSNYDTLSNLDYNSIIVYNIDKGKRYSISLPEGEIKKALIEADEIYPEYLFEEPKVKGSIITLTYSLNSESKINESQRTVRIDLKEYMDY
ncbi:MAG: hypothetical protein IPI46_10880 [Bacteroidetes bacterium]|nr:hypothetical protein [Bacteroidota bacterium]